MDDDHSYPEWRSEGDDLVGRTISHFRIMERIGQGGMGEVYEAEDTRLRRRVAFKVISSQSAGSESRRRRLIREARTAAAVSHPNIAVVHEVDEVDGVAFIAMERLAGPNLRTLLATGPLAVDEALRVATQMARGMAHAHRMRMVHRDLKPENVIVEPDGRVKILDFGLAKVATESLVHAAAEESTADVTAEGAFVGTIAYSSPEQLRGQAVEATTDVFSLGVVLHEMLTGVNPFRRTTPAAIVSAILSDTPPHASGAAPSSPTVLDRVIARCLAKDPAERFPSAEGVLRALEGLRPETAATPVRMLRRPWLIGTAGVAVLGLLGWLVVRGLAERPPGSGAPEEPTSSRAAAARRSVAVLGFQNLSGREDAAWLSTALSEMLTTELMAGGELRTVPGENIARMKLDLGVTEASSFGADTLARIRGQLRADFVVLGSFVDLGDRSGRKMRVDMRLQDARDAEVVTSVVQTGNQDDLFDLVALAGTKLRAALGVMRAEAGENVALLESLPSDTEAARRYAEGLNALRRFDALTARELLERSAGLDPERAATHAALASAWQMLGYETRQREAARRAYELSGGIPQEAKLSIEATYRTANREWDRALEIYGELHQLYPDDVEYVLRLARIQTQLGRGSDALTTLDAFRQREASQDARLDLEEADAASSLSDMQHAADAASRAAALATAAGARLVAAQATASEGWARSRLGEIDAARALLEDARDTFAAAGDRAGVARTLGHLAVILREQGDPAASIRTFERVVQIASDIGNKRYLSVSLNNMANVYYRQGDLDRAQSLYEQALEVDREADNRAMIPHRLGNLANVYSDRGDLQRSRSLHEQALAGFEGVGDQGAAARTLSNLGNLDLTAGRIASARARLEDAVARQRGLGLKRDIVNALENLGLVLLAQDDLAGARRSIEETLRIREELGEKDTVVRGRVYLGSVLVEEGKATDAERVAREAAEFAAQARDDGLRIGALTLLADALLRQGKLAEASRAIDEAATLAVDPFQRIPVTILHARIQAASGSVAEARQELTALLSDAKRRDLLGIELEGRLVEGEIDLRSGDAAAARERLAELERQARDAGLLLIARKCRGLAA